MVMLELFIFLDDIRLWKNRYCSSSFGYRTGEYNVILKRTSLSTSKGVISDAIFCGPMQAAFECAIEYAQKRTSFGKPISNLQAIQVCSSIEISVVRR